MNSRPPQCECDALPTEPLPHSDKQSKIYTSVALKRQEGKCTTSGWERGAPARQEASFSLFFRIEGPLLPLGLFEKKVYVHWAFTLGQAKVCIEQLHCARPCARGTPLQALWEYL